MAESSEELIGMLRKMRGVNAVFTRFHWQQDETVFDWCDRHGILVQEEVPLWGWRTPLNDTILALAKMHLDEMVGAHFNHASIVMWGVGNELASGDPATVRGVRQLYQYAKSIDSTRLVNYVSNKAAFSGGRDAIGEGDVLMFNEYQDTWYQGDPARVGGMLDTIHLDYPGRPMVISEYGVCEPAFQGGDERRINDMIYHTAVYESKPYVAGAIYFCLNDYRTHVGEAGEGVLKRRVHGVYDLQGNGKRSAQVLRRMSSPIKVINVPWKGNHLLELKLIGGGGLPSYLCSGYTLIWSSPGQDYLKGQRVSLPDLRANESTNVFLDQFAGDAVVVTLLRPSGDVVDTWEFTLEHQK
jgi:beta-galactosidase